MSGSKVKLEQLVTTEPITKAQKETYEAWDDNENLILTGPAGTGKTFVALYLAIEAVLEKEVDKVIILRSAVPVREVGFLPGKLEEKIDVFQSPYKVMCEELFDDKSAYNKLINSHQLQFETTSFIRGKTFNRCVLIVDEMQNLNFHELDSVMTRAGDNCRMIFCGDHAQSDFYNEGERNGLAKFLNIMYRMKNFTTVQFGWDDIVRSDIVRDYIMTKEMLGIH